MVQAAQAEISAKNIKPGTVCAQLNDGTVGAPCNPLNYSIRAATNGKVRGGGGRRERKETQERREEEGEGMK